MEKRNTLEFVKEALEALLAFNMADPEIEDVLQFSQTPGDCPVGVTYHNILRECMTKESYKAFIKELAAKYKKA